MGSEDFAIYCLLLLDFNSVDYVGWHCVDWGINVRIRLLLRCLCGGLLGKDLFCLHFGHYLFDWLGDNLDYWLFKYLSFWFRRDWLNWLGHLISAYLLALLNRNTFDHFAVFIYFNRIWRCNWLDIFACFSWLHLLSGFGCLHVLRRYCLGCFCWFRWRLCHCLCCLYLYCFDCLGFFHFLYGFHSWGLTRLKSLLDLLRLRIFHYLLRLLFRLAFRVQQISCIA